MNRIALIVSMFIIGFCARTAVGQQESDAKITHSFLATGAETYILGEDDKVVWQYPRSTRDGWVLPNGNVLLAVSKGGEMPGGGVVEVTREGKVVFEYKGTQSEVDTVQLVDGGNILLTESGPKPRLMEINRDGKIAVEFPLKCQTENHHMETRMARKLANGNYLVPHLLDKVVREYKADGSVVWEAKTPAEPKESWPFTAIRLKNGNTLVDCTHGNLTVEFDATGKIVWQVSNADFPSLLFADPCGAQRLPNGNTVITSYGAKQDDVKMFEVTPDKKVVWTYKSGKPHGIHHFQILTTNGKPVEGRPMR